MCLRREFCDLLGLGTGGIAKRLGTIDARFRLAGSGLGRPAEPFELGAEEVLTVCLGAICMGQPVCFGLQICMPTSIVAVHLALIDLEGSVDDPIEDVAVMRDQNERTAVLLAQVGLEPFDGVGVEVVGRLIENRQAGLLDQESRERNASPLAAAHLIDAPIHFNEAELLEKHIDAKAVFPAAKTFDFLGSGRLWLRVGFPSRFLRGDQPAELLVSLEGLGPGTEPFEDDVPRIAAARQVGFLRQIANGRLTAAGDTPRVRLLFTDQDARQSRLARAVVPDEPNSLPFVNRKADAIEKSRLAVGLAKAFSHQDRHVRRSLGVGKMTRSTEVAGRAPRPQGC